MSVLVAGKGRQRQIMRDRGAEAETGLEESSIPRP